MLETALGVGLEREPHRPRIGLGCGARGAAAEGGVAPHRFGELEVPALDLGPLGGERRVVRSLPAQLLGIARELPQLCDQELRVSVHRVQRALASREPVPTW